MDIANTMGGGTRGVGFAVMGEEFLYMLYEARFLLVFVGLLIILDFNLGRKESAVRYEAAKESGDTYSINKYRWRTSRALRRSANKFVEYLLYCLVGLFFGAALLEPIGVPMIFGTYLAAAFIAWCIERRSIRGHLKFLYANGVDMDGFWQFAKRFAVSLTKKYQNVGEALEEALNARKD